MPRDSERSSIYTDTGRLGFLYCLTNAHMPGLVKIGCTRKHPLQRAEELGAGTGVPGGFELAYYRDYQDAFTAERLTHERFESALVNADREFFRVSLADVVAFINALPTSVDYRDQLASQGVVGGTYQEVTAEEAYPWASLFQTFNEDSKEGELTPAERAECRVLEERLRYGR